MQVPTVPPSDQNIKIRSGICVYLFIYFQRLPSTTRKSHVTPSHFGLLIIDLRSSYDNHPSRSHPWHYLDIVGFNKPYISATPSLPISAQLPFPFHQVHRLSITPLLHQTWVSGLSFLGELTGSLLARDLYAVSFDSTSRLPKKVLTVHLSGKSIRIFSGNIEIYLFSRLISTTRRSHLLLVISDSWIRPNNDPRSSYHNNLSGPSVTLPGPV